MSDPSYLFAYFTGESEDGEQIYFSVSKDGLHWKDINEGQPVLKNTIGTKGVRDPFLFRSVIDGQYYILGTDLRIAGGVDWETAKNAGSTQIIIWTSSDLIHWSPPWSFSVNIRSAGCAWAPEAVYDAERNAYLVFWASYVDSMEKKEKKQVIYRSYTRDFRQFTESCRYMEYSYDVIDTTIIRHDGWYYRFYKDEIEKYIRVDRGHNLLGEFEEIHTQTLKQLKGVEGAIVYPLKKQDRWCLLADRFAAGRGYLPLCCNNLNTSNFMILPDEQYHMGKTLKRHGSVLMLDERMQRS